MSEPGEKVLTDIFEIAIERSPLGIMIADSQSKLIFANKKTERIFGYSRNQLLERFVRDIILDSSGEYHDLLTALPETESPEIREMLGIHADGSRFPLDIGLEVIQRGNIATASIHRETRLFLLATMTDITQRKFLEKQIRERDERQQRINEELVRSNVELQRFAYIASHDLKSPLQSIGGFADLIKLRHGEHLDEEAIRWIGIIQRSVGTMNRLINGLLEYAKLNSVSSSFKIVPFNEVVRDAIILLDSVIKETDAKINCDDLPEVLGDRSELVQLTQNIIGNAIKYHGKEKPVVSLSVTPFENSWRFSIKDNGIGIDPRFDQQIFEMFTRLHSQSDFPGSGIGLAICRRIIDHHSGKIWVESNPGAGSVFNFTLPKV